MAAPTPATYTNGNNGSSTCITPMPTGIQVGELIKAVFAASGTMSTPTGWALKTNANNVWVFYKYADGTEGASVTFTSTSTISMYVAERITGAVTAGDPFDFATITNGGLGTVSASMSGTTLGTDRLLMLLDAKSAARTPTVDPSGMTLQTTGSWFLHAWHKAQAAAGATGSLQATYSGLAVTHATLLTAVKSPEVRTGDTTGTAIASATAVEVEIATGSVTAQVVASATVAEVEIATGTVTATSDATSTVVEVEITTGSVTVTADTTATSTPVEIRTGSSTATADLTGEVAAQVETRTGSADATAELTAVGYPYGGELTRAGTTDATAIASATAVTTTSGDATGSATASATVVVVAISTATVSATAVVAASAVVIETRHTVAAATAIFSATAYTIETRTGPVTAAATLTALAAQVETRTGALTAAAVAYDRGIIAPAPPQRTTTIAFADRITSVASSSRVTLLERPDRTTNIPETDRATQVPHADRRTGVQP